ncbi:MAG: hypothetical protein K0R39_1164 [Symbiobacteriaceae bacterium]|jgi:hypothetical protein|nr:hypothetical protein [Symbiobacteriaceae bacterium]
MIVDDTLRRYIARWRTLALGGLFPVLVTVLIDLLRSQLAGAAALKDFTQFLISGRNPTAIIGAAFDLGSALLLVSIVSLLLAPFGQGALTYAVVRVQRDLPVALGDLVQAGLRYWGRLLRLNLIMIAIGIGLFALSFIRQIPVLGPLAWVLGFALVLLAVGGYGPYLIVSEDLGATAATGRAFQILSRKFADLFLTLLVLLAGGLIVGAISLLITALVTRVPGRDFALLNVAFQVFVMPLATLYLAFRYQRNIAPELTPPGGQGRFDPGPPHGA